MSERDAHLEAAAKIADIVARRHARFVANAKRLQLSGEVSRADEFARDAAREIAKSIRSMKDPRP